MANKNFAPWDKDARRSGIGGSEAAAVAGVSPWQTPLELWEIKTGSVEPEDISNVPAVKWGNLLEPLIRSVIMEDYGIKIMKDSKTHYNPKLSYLYSHTDGRIAGTKWIVEIKTPGIYTEKHWKDGIPEYVKMQNVHMMCCEPALEGVQVYALKSGRELFQYLDPRDEELIDLYLTKAHKFWRCVDMDTPPEPVNLSDFNKVRADDLSPDLVSARPDLEKLLEEFERIDTDAKHYAARGKELSLQIRKLIGHHAGYADGQGRITRLSAVSKKVFNIAKFSEKMPTRDIWMSPDPKKIKEVSPSVYEEFCEVVRTTRLLPHWSK